MTDFPKKLKKKLDDRVSNNAFRKLTTPDSSVDFSSNDYLGFARNKSIFSRASEILSEKCTSPNGATGSRLLSGNHGLYSDLENMLIDFHQAESALVFNSGYDANIGFFSSVPQRGDVVFYDELIHASIRDGIKMGNAKSYKFEHNNVKSLENKCHAERSRSTGDPEIYIVTESVFSMDGDSPNLKALVELCTKNNYRLLVDEAHAVGIFGKRGEGLVQELGLQELVFARTVTFGKALGCHGAAILGSKNLREYLVNFARSFIYTTGLPPHSVASIVSAYEYLLFADQESKKLKENINYFNQKLRTLPSRQAGLNLEPNFIYSNSAIHSCIIPGNDKVKNIANKLRENGFDVRPILSPTVPEGKERLRFCLHSYNITEEIDQALILLTKFI